MSFGLKWYMVDPIGFFNEWLLLATRKLQFVTSITIALQNIGIVPFPIDSLCMLDVLTKITACDSFQLSLWEDSLSTIVILLIADYTTIIFVRL